MAAKKSDGKAEIVASVDWSTVATWDDAVAVSQLVVSAAEVFGDGAQLMEKKNIVGKGEFLVLDWRVITDKETLRDYVSVLAINRGNEKFRFNDGSTGIKKQLLEFQEKHGIQTIYCREMTVSEYQTTNDAGDPISGKTYYLA